MNIRIGNKIIGNNKPCFIVAEISGNHNGNINNAKKLIFNAKKCGADAVKFQTFKAENIVTTETDQAINDILTPEVQDQLNTPFLNNIELTQEQVDNLRAAITTGSGGGWVLAQLRTNCNHQRGDNSDNSSSTTNNNMLTQG